MDEKHDWHLTDDIAHERGRGDPFAAAVRATRMPMVITDPRQDDNPIIFCNEAFQTLSGYARDEIVGRNCRFLQGPDTDKAAVRRIHDAIERGEDVAVDLLNYRKDGSSFWNALYLSPVRNREGEIEFFFASQLDVTERVNAKALVEAEVERRTADLSAALEAKTLLLHEVDHRVKNNLTMIGSLLRLQARSIADPSVSATLEAMLRRVDALATVHRRLYQSDDVTLFDVGAFTSNLIDDVIGASGRDDIRVESEVGRIDVPSSMAAPLGLILNEVLTNAVKHAYADGRGGTVRVTAATAEDGTTATIAITDDGPGLADDPESAEGLGVTLIRRLSQQVEATVDWIPVNAGLRVALTFPVRSA